jgi:hypothetical protein
LAICICKFFTLLAFCNVYKVFLLFAHFFSSQYMSAPLCDPGLAFLYWQVLHSFCILRSLYKVLKVFLQFFSHVVVCLHHFVIQVSGIFVFANFALFWHPAVFTKSYCASQIFPHPVYVCATL